MSDMKIERVYTDGFGKRVRVVFELNEDDRLEAAIRDLANKARASKGGRVATALRGAVRVAVRELED